MKKYLSTYILLASLLFTGCADLDQTSISSIDKDNFYQSKEDIETAINGIYQAFTIDGFYGMYNNQSIYFNDLQSDYVKAGAREFLGNFLCLVNQQLTRAACSKDTNEKQNVPKSFLCCFLGTKVQIFRETTKSS